MADVEAQVAHIWRRLGFGGTPAEINAGKAMGTTALVDWMAARPAVSTADSLLESTALTERDILRRVLELWAFGPVAPSDVKISPAYNPIQERLSWILQGLLVCGMDVVDLAAMRTHVILLRDAFTSTHRRTLRLVSTKPGVLRYLTGDQNVRGHPNLNYAREVMELFTLGRVNLATGAFNYNEADVAEVARACTGWRYNWETGNAYFSANHWDPGTKTFLGASRGAANLDAVLDVLKTQPAWSQYVPARLYTEITGLTPTPQVLSQLAGNWGADGNYARLIQTIAKRPEFLADSTILNKVKSPVERVVSASRLLGWKGLARSTDLTWLMLDQQQHPFYPPNVSGWPRGDQWLSTASLQSWVRMANRMAMQGFNYQGLVVSKTNPATELVFGAATSATAANYVISLAGLKGVVSQRTFNNLDAYAKAGFWNRYRAAGLLNLLLVSPEFLAN